MGRYTGPKTRVSRRYGVPIFGSSKSLERKNYPPGMHGPKGSRRKQSDYAIALGEKQKLRYQYGLLERQFRRIFQNALRKRGVTGETLLQLLETRIDNVVFRLGLANTRSAARQLVSHGHVLVNGRGVNIASYNVKAGDEITIEGFRAKDATNTCNSRSVKLPDGRRAFVGSAEDGGPAARGQAKQ